MSVHITLDDLAAIDAEIAQIEASIEYHKIELSLARGRLDAVRARQFKAVELYNETAASPLNEP